MSWGSPFRSTWDAALSGARAAAREAVTSPEKAASLMSESMAHTLQRTLYAARDLRRLQQAAASAEVSTPQSAALRSAMDDIRLGKVRPEQAEKHVQLALQPHTGTDAAPDGDRHDDGEHAALRFVELRKRLLEQLDEAQQRWPADSVPADARSNAAFARALDRSFAEIDALFLENKLVDDPAVPLPAGPRPMKEKA